MDLLGRIKRSAIIVLALLGAGFLGACGGGGGGISVSTQNLRSFDPNYIPDLKSLTHWAAFPVKVYFATPYHSWERGSNENFNGLLRQYLPKGTCMSAVSQTQCDHIADDLNNRPRKRFGFNTPASQYHRN